jgi:hypothetical protein
LPTGKHKNLQICGLRIVTCICGLAVCGEIIKISSLRLADWHTEENCGFAITENDPKNLRNHDLQINEQKLAGKKSQDLLSLKIKTALPLSVFVVW